MALNLQFAPIDAALLARLDAHRTGKALDDLQRTLAETSFYSHSGDRLWLDRVERVGDYPPHRLWPLRVRVNPTAHARQAAGWFVSADDEPAFRALVDLCRADDSEELPTQYWVLLSWFSEAYRLDATGLTAQDPWAEQLPPYDGPPALLDGVGGPVRHGDAVWRYVPPDEVPGLAAELETLDASSPPLGDLGALRDLYEDAGYDPDQLGDDAAEGLAFLVRTYGSSASRRQGLRIHG